MTTYLWGGGRIGDGRTHHLEIFYQTTERLVVLFTMERCLIVFLLKELDGYSRSIGAKYCYINFDNKFLIDVCESLGFVKGSVTQEMIKTWDHRQQG
jgi:hypothetical protein